MQRSETQIDLATRIVTEALTWDGTPFHHQGRLKQVGVDCVGLLLETFRPFGIVDFDIDGYARAPDEATLIDTLDEKSVRLVDMAEILPVDMLVFGNGRKLQHIAMATDCCKIIHATAKYGVRHHSLSSFMKPSRIYRIEELL